MVFNTILTLFGWFLGSFHAVWYFIDYERTKSLKQIKANKKLIAPLSLETIFNRLRGLQLTQIQIIVSIISGILAIILGIKGLFFGVNILSENQTKISSNIPEKSSYVCSFKSSTSLRYRLEYRNVIPKLRDTPEVNENNVRGQLKSKNQLIYLASNNLTSNNIKWYYVCIEGEKVYGWVRSDNVIKQN